MKRYYTSLLSLIWLLLAFTNTSAIGELYFREGTTDEGLNWSVTCTDEFDSSSCYILKISGNGVIHSDSTNYRTVIPWQKYSSSIVMVEIENDATEIGDYYFYGFEHIMTVDIPDNVTKIGKRAFSDCIFLFEISGMKNVMSIEDNAFYGCISLTKIVFSDKLLHN